AEKLGVTPEGFWLPYSVDLYFIRHNNSTRVCSSVLRNQLSDKHTEESCTSVVLN
ncbi:hypothetical protein AMELA_G00186420, partial [Ameiurus melas]